MKTRCIVLFYFLIFFCCDAIAMYRVFETGNGLFSILNDGNNRVLVYDCGCATRNHTYPRGLANGFFFGQHQLAPNQPLIRNFPMNILGNANTIDIMYSHLDCDHCVMTLHFIEEVYTNNPAVQNINIYVSSNQLLQENLNQGNVLSTHLGVVVQNYNQANRVFNINLLVYTVNLQHQMVVNPLPAIFNGNNYCIYESNLQQANGNMVILAVTINDRKLLLTGDANAKHLIDYLMNSHNQRGDDLLGKVSFLMMSHHGSNVSAEWAWFYAVRNHYDSVNNIFNDRLKHFIAMIPANNGYDGNHNRTHHPDANIELLNTTRGEIPVQVPRHGILSWNNVVVQNITSTLYSSRFPINPPNHWLTYNMGGQLDHTVQ